MRAIRQSHVKAKIFILKNLYDHTHVSLRPPLTPSYFGLHLVKKKKLVDLKPDFIVKQDLPEE